MVNLRKASTISTILFVLTLSACTMPFQTEPTGGAANTPASAATAASVSSNGTSRCIGVQADPNEKIPTDGGTKKWSAPETVTFADHIYCAILTTNKGRVVVELYPQVAPKNVNNFVFLAKQGFYENLTWHRVLPGFVAQTGDPTATGTGGPGYTVPLEVSPSVKYDREGRVGVARSSDPDSAGSQFFITFQPVPQLDPSSQTAGYTIIGQVVEGMNVLRQITPRDPSQNPNLPAGDPLISVRIVDLTK